MARIKLSVPFDSVSGRLGKVVYYNIYKRQFARVHTIPENPRTDEQQQVRKTFGNAVRSWQNRSPEEKNKYNKKARRLAMSGYNLYISEYIKEDIKSKQENHTISVTDNMLNHSSQSLYSSVASPLHLLHSSYSDSIQAVQSSGMG